MRAPSKYQPPHCINFQNSGIIFLTVQLNQVDPQKQHEHCSTAATSNVQFSALHVLKRLIHIVGVTCI